MHPTAYLLLMGVQLFNLACENYSKCDIYPPCPHWWTSGDGPNESNKSCAHSAEGTSRCDRNAPWQGAFYTSVNAQCLCHHTVPRACPKSDILSEISDCHWVLLKDSNFRLWIHSCISFSQNSVSVRGWISSVRCFWS